MITYKSFLEIKRIVELDELNNGEIAFFDDKIVLKDFSGNIKYIELYNGEASFTLYGIRVPVAQTPEEMTDNTIERVLIKRTLNSNGDVIDTEYIGDETELEFNFTSSNEMIGNFESDKLNSLHPFNAMSVLQYKIQPTKQYVSDSQTAEEIDSDFTKLPLFFKNKVKLRTVNDVSYDYYLISDVWFDDFYPVESHLKQDGSYADVVWLESNWRITNLNTNTFGVSSAFFNGDYVVDSEDNNNPTFIINESIWFDYLYYIYMIKTASFNPILSSLDNTGFSINDSISYIYYDTQTTSYKSVFNNIDVNKEFTISSSNFTISSFSSTQIIIDINASDEVVESIKNNLPDNGYYCLALTNDLSGLNYTPMSSSYITDGCAEFYGVINKNINGYPHRLVFSAYGELTEPSGYQSILPSQHLYVLLIKTIPPFVCGVLNNQITNSGDVCIDNIKNIFPVYFSNGMFKSLSEEYLSDNSYIFSLPYNYSIYIDSGSHSSWFNTSTSKPQNILTKLRTKLQYNYFDGVFADYQENTNNITSTSNNKQINCIISFDNKKVKQKDIYCNGVTNSSDITDFSTRQGCIRGNLNGCLFENTGDSYPWQEYELFTGCLLKNNTVTIGWNNFTINQRDTKESGTTETRLNNDCVTRLMFFE